MSQQCHIAWVLHHDNPGGAELHTWSLIGNLPADGYSHSVFVLAAMKQPRGKGLWDELSARARVAIDLSGLPRGDLKLRTLAGCWLSDPPDVIVAPARVQFLEAVEFLGRWRPPTVHVRHRESIPFVRRRERSLRDVVDHLVFVSEASYRRGTNTLGDPPPVCHFIPNAARPVAPGESLRAELGWRDGEVVVGYVGRIEDDKNVDGLVRAFHGSAADRLLIAGGGGERPKVEKLVGRLGLEERVSLIGWRDDIGSVYETIDVLALASPSEAAPLVILEAMSLGVPVVATDTGDARAMLGDGGIVVPTGDCDALRSAIDRLAGDRDLRERLGRAGRERSEAYSLDHMVARYDEILRRAAAMGPQRQEGPDVRVSRNGTPWPAGEA